MRAESVISFKDARSYYKKLFINFESDRLPEEDLKRLFDVLNNNKGECEVWFKINGKTDCRRFRSRSIKINPEPSVLMEIKNIIGDAALQIYGQI